MVAEAKRISAGAALPMDTEMAGGQVRTLLRHVAINAPEVGVFAPKENCPRTKAPQNKGAKPHCS
eukprot:1157637-Pelagomonas_calceolata.AAC.8